LGVFLEPYIRQAVGGEFDFMVLSAPSLSSSYLFHHFSFYPISITKAMKDLHDDRGSEHL
jgi:hypothetical protein